MDTEIAHFQNQAASLAAQIAWRLDKDGHRSRVEGAMKDWSATLFSLAVTLSNGVDGIPAPPRTEASLMMMTEKSEIMDVIKATKATITIIAKHIVDTLKESSAILDHSNYELYTSLYPVPDGLESLTEAMDGLKEALAMAREKNMSYMEVLTIVAARYLDVGGSEGEEVLISVLKADDEVV